MDLIYLLNTCDPKPRANFLKRIAPFAAEWDDAFFPMILYEKLLLVLLPFMLKVT